MKPLKKCNLCGGNRLIPLFLVRDKNLYLPGKFPLIRCEKCGVILLGISPDLRKLEKYYPKEYYSYKKIDTNSLKYKIKTLLYKTYFDKEGGKLLLRAVFSPFLPFIRGTIIKRGSKLLDIGSGSGQFLYEMKQFGIETYGVEPGEYDKKSAKEHDLNIQNTDLLKAGYGEASFDVITLNHVLEHIKDPKKTLEEIYRVLKKSGELIVAVPNHSSLAFFLFKKNWYQLDAPRHLNNFSRKILARILKEGGFKIDKIRYNSRPMQFTVSLFYALNINPKKHNWSVNLLNLFFLPLTYFVNALKIGDQIEIYCSK